MTEEQIHRAEQAERLRTDPAFQRAVVEIRRQAVEALVKADPVDADAIRAQQARINAIDALCGEIANEILRGTPQRQPAVA